MDTQGRVPITIMEWWLAYMCAGHRRAESNARGLNTWGACKLSNLQTDFDGALAELAVAKHLGVTWPCLLNDFNKSPDVLNFHVRSTRYQNGCLIVRANDPSDGIFVLVTIEPRDKFCNIIGTARCDDIRIKEHHRPKNNNGDEYWEAPQSFLRPWQETVRALRLS